MGIRSYIQRKGQERFNKRMSSYVKGVGEMEYNPKYGGRLNVLTNDRYTVRLVENGVWYAGIDHDLALFYQRNVNKMRNNSQISDALNYFWKNADRDIRRLHSGVPQLISEKMVDLIVGNGYDINLLDAIEDDEDNMRLHDILEDNSFNNVLQKGIETESWSGSSPFKITHNKLVSDYPIIEVAEPETYSYRAISGRIVEDIFTTYPEDGDGKYRLKEMYGVEYDGDVPVSYIRYKLERTSKDKDGANWTEVSLDSLPSTANLTDINVRGYDKKFSLYKGNKFPNSEFRGSLLGESDYSGSIGAFDAVDEILSIWIQEARDGKLNRYMPNSLMPKNRYGETVASKIVEKDHIIYEGTIAEKDNHKIEYHQGEINSDQHIESYKSWMMIILNNAGLSPLTVGMTGLEAMNAGEQSQKEREKVSIRTRNKKVELWEEFLNDFIERVMVFDDVMSTAELNEENGSITATINEYPINTVFADYVLKSKADRTTEVAAGIAGMGWDIKTGVDYIHEEKTATERLAISANIKIENDIQTLSVAEASALEYLNKSSEEKLIEEDVDVLDVEQEEDGGQEFTNEVDIDENDDTPPPEDQVEE